MDTLQQDLPRIRKELGWSQQTLAEKSFLSQNTISQFETGARRLSTEMFFFLLSVMEVTFQYSFTNNKGEIMMTQTKQQQISAEPIDFRAIQNEEGFRLWVLQRENSKITVIFVEDQFMVYENEEYIFHLYEELFNFQALLRICEEEGIQYDQL